MKEYSWNVGGLFNADPNEVGKELEKLGDNLTASNVVEVAKDESNVLHNCFEWDDKEAGKKYRLVQARNLICNIKVTIKKETETEGPVKVRAFLNTKKNENYKSIEAIINDTNEYSRLLEKAYKELNVTKNKYTELQEIQDLLKDIPEY